MQLKAMWEKPLATNRSGRSNQQQHEGADWGGGDRKDNRVFSSGCKLSIFQIMTTVKTLLFTIAV